MQAPANNSNSNSNAECTTEATCRRAGRTARRVGLAARNVAGNIAARGVAGAANAWPHIRNAAGRAGVGALNLTRRAAAVAGNLGARGARGAVNIAGRCAAGTVNIGGRCVAVAGNLARRSATAAAAAWPPARNAAVAAANAARRGIGAAAGRTRNAAVAAWPPARNAAVGALGVAGRGLAAAAGATRNAAFAAGTAALRAGRSCARETCVMGRDAAIVLGQLDTELSPGLVANEDDKRIIASLISSMSDPAKVVYEVRSAEKVAQLIETFFIDNDDEDNTTVESYRRALAVPGIGNGIKKLHMFHHARQAGAGNGPNESTAIAMAMWLNLEVADQLEYDDVVPEDLPGLPARIMGGQDARRARAEARNAAAAQAARAAAQAGPVRPVAVRAANANPYLQGVRPNTPPRGGKKRRTRTSTRRQRR